MITENSLWFFRIEDAKGLAARVLRLFNESSLDEAIREAWDAQVDPDVPPAIFIPTRNTTYTAFIAALQDPSKHDVYEGEKTGDRAIYGYWEAASSGRTVRDNVHRRFLVYYPTHQILADLIDRDGKTLIPEEILQSYLLYLGNVRRYAHTI